MAGSTAGDHDVAFEDVDPRSAAAQGAIEAELKERSRAIGHHTIRLDTNATLTTAIALYERSGYVAIDRYNDNPYAHRWFEKLLP